MKRYTYAIPRTVDRDYCDYFTAGKPYPVLGKVTKGSWHTGYFFVVADNGDRRYCCTCDCPHICGDWTITEIEYPYLSPARKHELVWGLPVSCWDCGPGVADRWTVVYLYAAYDPPGRQVQVAYVGMSDDPCHPQGVGQHGEMPLANATYTGRGGVFRKRIGFADLPRKCQKLVLSELKADWRGALARIKKGEKPW